MAASPRGDGGQGPECQVPPARGAGQRRGGPPTGWRGPQPSGASTRNFRRVGSCVGRGDRPASPGVDTDTVWFRLLPGCPPRPVPRPPSPGCHPALPRGRVAGAWPPATATSTPLSRSLCLGAWPTVSEGDPSEGDPPPLPAGFLHLPEGGVSSSGVCGASPWLLLEKLRHPGPTWREADPEAGLRAVQASGSSRVRRPVSVSPG